MNNIINDIIYIGSGVQASLILLLGGLVLGGFLGCLLSITRYLNFGKFIINGFISIIRGTPLILQLSIIYFSFPGIFGVNLSIISAGILTFGLNSSAYTTEILRASINSIPQGQFEAAKSLQIPNYYMWRDIILPQVIRNVSPALVNETISLLKETALIGTIGGLDIMRASQLLAAEKFTYFQPLCIAAAYYYILVMIIAYLGKKVEKWSHYDSN